MNSRLAAALLASPLLLLALSITGISELCAQSLPVVNEFTIPGAPTLSRFGDVDGNGIEELLLRTDAVAPVQGFPASAIEVISGASASPIVSLPPVSYDSIYYWANHVGDLDGDGDAEFVTIEETSILGVATNTTIRIGSGPNNDLVWQFSPQTLVRFMGTALDTRRAAPLGDLDADGVNDLCFISAFSSSFGGFSSRLYVVTIINPLTQATIFQRISGLNVPMSFCAVDDVNGDGHDDFLISTNTGLSQPLGGTTGLFSGADFSVLRSWHGSQPDEQRGFRVSSIEDLDGDQIRDVVLAAPGFTVGGNPVGRLTAHSSATGALLWQATGTTARPLHFAAGVSHWWQRSDYDGDGYRDFATSTTFNSRWIDQIFSGFDGSSLVVPTIPTAASAFLLPAGDTNGDGIAEVISAETIPTPIPGMPLDPLTMTTFRLVQDLGAARYGSSTPGSSLTLDWRPFSSEPRRGQIELSGASPGASLWLGLSLVAGNGSLIQGQHPLWISPLPGELFGVIPVTADSAGSYRAPVNLHQPAFDGMRLFAQVAQLTLPDSVSNGVELLFTD